MNLPDTRAAKSRWLAHHGPQALESLFRAVIFQPSTPILVTDDDRRYHEASVGATRLLGLRREKIIGRYLDDFAADETKAEISDRWRHFLKAGEQAGTLRLLTHDGKPRDMQYTARRNVLPVRHLLWLHSKQEAAANHSWVRDCALLLLRADGAIADWYAGAERIYGHARSEAVGQHVSILYPDDHQDGSGVGDALRRAAGLGHSGDENWHQRKDSTRFWANAIFASLKDEGGALHGFACVVRDFSDRRENNEKFRRGGMRANRAPRDLGIAGVVSGEFDRITQANDTFLELAGYSREDLLDDRLAWLDLTPRECVPLDEFAHEECLRFGSCAPFEKELIRQDGTRVPVLVTTAVLELFPFRWITFVSDLRERDRQESIEANFSEEMLLSEEIVGTSTALKRMISRVELVAPTDATVLILGETGTGKELVARAIHRKSLRGNRPFVTLNCAAIPTGLLESELFGYERGAFTGALTQKKGRFELANGGTLFLDEVGDIPLVLQPKLLRALQEKAFERLGSTATINIDVRLVAATNQNLAQMMKDHLFRSDLYYRLKVFPIVTAPLRDRPEDIPVLAQHFTQKYARRMNRTIEKIPSHTMRALVNWSWPGNVRELENFIERSVILSPGPELRAPVEELRAARKEAFAPSTLEEMEKQHVVRVLRESGGVVSVAANVLGVPRTTLNAIMRKLGISRIGP
ncbi:MAG: sigma 54-interacting transcriptional regulator [Acidobacteriota bacterium]